MKLFVIIAVLGCVSVCQAVRQQWTFHTGFDCTGEEVVFLNRQPNLEGEPIMSTHKSFSFVGLWGLYKSINYINADVLYEGGDNSVCHNHTLLGSIKSLRYLGPSDTNGNALSLYKELNMAGQEITLTEPAPDLDKFPFIPKSLVLFGNTNWTFYKEYDFGGVGICAFPNNEKWYEIRDYLSGYGLTDTKSVRKYCYNKSWNNQGALALVAAIAVITTFYSNGIKF